MTIAICTYNRCELLGGAIESVCTQPVDPTAYEVLVVDNASTDATLEVVAAAQARFPRCTVRYVLETEPGVAHARNRALLEACGKFLAFVDDDGRFAPAYMVYALDTLLKKPELDCLGGPIYPFYTARPPRWFKSVYEARSWGTARRYLRSDESFSGSNMVWRVSSLKSGGGFPTGAGMSGMRVLMGEEPIAFSRVRAVKPDALFLYLPHLITYHWTPAHKMRVAYWLKRAFAGGQSYARVHDDGSLAAKAAIAARGVALVARSALRALLRAPCHQAWQNWAVEELAPACNGLGRLAELLRVPVTVKR